jgi:hypothetical protein
MKKLFLVVLTFVFVGLTTTKAQEVKNYYGIPKTLKYGDVEYKLAASYHPSKNYYKQEYVPANESVDHFNRMLIVDLYITDAANKTIAQAKEKELSKRKATDVACNYEQFENSELNEYMLDFILSDANQDKISIAEHNTYRYKNYTDKAGHKGVLLVGASQRAYLEKIGDFWKWIKENKIKNINTLAAYEMPQIEIN